MEANGIEIYLVTKYVDNILLSFTSQFYLWKGKVLKYMEGGPIGVKATGTCPNVVMDQLILQFRKTSEANGTEIYILTKSVDDVLHSFNTQFYHWKGKVFKQMEGGPIGVRATGTCTKVVID